MDLIISVDFTDKNIDPELHATVSTSMVHGPCGVLNPQSPCMNDGKCSKRYPRPLLAQTVTDNDGYPSYRRRSIADNGQFVVLRLKNREIKVDNRWVVPYCPLLSRVFDAHINVEYCNSVKSVNQVHLQIRQQGRRYGIIRYY